MKLRLHRMGASLLLFLLFLATAERSDAASITWTNAAGGLWNVPANWSPNQVPEGVDIAVITVDGIGNAPAAITMDISPTVAGLVLGATSNCGNGQVLSFNGHTLTLDGPALVNTCGQLTIDSGTLAGTTNAIVSGMISWTGGSLSGTLTLATNSVLKITGGRDHDMASCVVSNYGTVTWSGGRLRGGGGGNGTQVHNFGLWDAQSDQDFNADYDGAGALFRNAGTFRKSASTNATSFVGGVAFLNTGAVEVESGTLALNSGGSFTGGSITNGAGIVALAAGPFTINGTVTSTNVQLVGGTLRGTNVIQGALNWVVGDWSGAAGVTIATNSLLNIVSASNHDLPDCLVTNFGTVAWSGGRLRGGGNGGTLVQNFGLWDAQSDQVFNDDYDAKAVLFNNAGTLRKSASTNVTSLLNGVAFVNTGVVDVESGTLAFNSGGNFLGGSVISPGGVVKLAAGAFTINGTVTSANVQLVGGTLTGANVIQGALDWVVGDWSGASGVTIAPKTVLNIVSGNDHNMPDCLVTNFGTVAWRGGRVRGGGNGGTLVQNFGVWDAQSDQVFDNDFDGKGVLFNNAGTFRKSASTNVTSLLDGVTFLNTGAVDIESGALALNSGGSFTGGSTTGGAGFVELTAGAFTINGTITSTNVQMVGGTLKGTNVIQGALDWVFGDWSGAAGVTIATNSVLNITGGRDHDMASCVVSNYGTVTWSGGRLRGGGGGNGTQVHNFGLWDAQSDQAFNADFDGTGAIFNNAGTFRKSASTNATSFVGGVAFLNTGAVDIESGTLALNSGGSFTGGSITNGAGIVALAAGAFTINGTITSTNVQLVGGTLRGTNVIQGALNWVIGDWSGAAGVTIATNSLLNIVSASDHNMPDCLVTNFGTVSWSGGRLRGGGNGGTLIQNFGLWDAQSDQVFNDDYDAKAVLFNNAGTFRKSASTNVTSLLNGVAFVNTGVVDVESGTLAFNSGGNFIGGSVISPHGVVKLASGAFTINGTVTSANVQLVGGTLTGANVIQGALDWVVGDWNGASGVTIAPKTVLNIISGNDHNMPDCLVTNFGTVAWSSGRVRGGGNSGTLVSNFGVWDAQSDQVFNDDFDGKGVLFNNAGTFRKSAGGASGTTLASSVAFSSTGLVDTQAGTLNFSGGFTQSGGAFGFGLGSLTEFGQVNISGTAPLTAQLHINLKNGFQPGLSNSFPVMTYSSSTGTLTEVTGCSIGNGLFLDAVDTGSRLLLIAKDGTPHLDSVQARMANGQFLFRLTTGTAGQTFIIEASTTLKDWLPISTNTLPDCILEFVDPDALNFSERFYRSILVP